MLDEKWFQIIPISYINPIMQYIRALITILNSMHNEKCILMMPITLLHKVSANDNLSARAKNPHKQTITTSCPSPVLCMADVAHGLKYAENICGLDI